MRRRWPLRAANLTVIVLLAAGLRLLVTEGGARRRMGPGRTPALDAPPVTPPTAIPPGRTFTIAAAGDIAGPGNHQQRTAALLSGLLATDGLAAILALGDTQYPTGAYRDYLLHYAPTWGVPALKRLTRPVPGNHEYDQGLGDAEGYFDYFDGPDALTGPAGERDRGWYSFDMGDWHFIALNTSDGCHAIPCGPGSPMHRWLVRDLATTDRACVLAYLHHPRFLRGDVHRDNDLVAPLWDALLQAHADVVLAGHEHNYQQLAPMDGAGRRDDARGIRSFIVGTGGADPYLAPDQGHADSVETTELGRFGVLVMALSPGAYSWRFLAATADGQGEVRATGHDVCR